MFPYLRPYRQPLIHEAVSRILRLHSVNPADVRREVLKGRDLSEVRAVLELGCGYGFMTELISRRVHAQAHIVGIDACPDDRAPFRERVLASGRRPGFRCMDVHSELPWPSSMFDLVVACYSLYFFPDVIPEVSRVLSPGGRFLVVTHSESSVRDMLRVAGVPTEGSTHLELVRRFSAESGEECLRPYFNVVEAVEYPNRLHFDEESMDDLMSYLKFKFQFIADWPEYEPELHALLERDIREQVGGGGSVEVEKNDTAFWAAEPLVEASGNWSLVLNGSREGDS